MSLPSRSVGTMPQDAPEASLLASSEFRDALLSALALLAHADGEMAGAERRRILSLACENVLLADERREAIVEALAMHEANFRLDPEVAQLLARENLVRVAGQRRLSQMIVKACQAVLPADGICHPSEYRMLGEIRTLLEVERHAVAPPLPTPSGSC